MRRADRTTARRGRARAAGGLLGALLAATAGLVLTAAPASAHNVVVDTSPGTGATVAEAPAQVSVTFDDVVLDLTGDGSSTVVHVTDAAGGEHASGCPTTQDRTVTVPVAVSDPGEYTVAWRIVSADGHPTSGEYSFTYAPDDAGAAAPATGSSTGTSASGCGSGAGSAAAEPADTQGSGGSGDLLVVLGITGGVVVLAGAGVLVALRLSRPRA